MKNKEGRRQRAEGRRQKGKKGLRPEVFFITDYPIKEGKRQKGNKSLKVKVFL
ncbi:MAG: hypothetical protein F6K17_20925 [Okeania sp. SIO3C4]|nr:hypothetical protein [Okeania sp. SIO3B3]NER04886.1 hypothetical protein [Okeania sp. SIO3C4]